MNSQQTIQQDSAFKETLLANQRQERVKTGKVAAALVCVLMPFGSLLDQVVYPEKVNFFLMLRVFSVVLAAIIWMLFRHPFGWRHYKKLGLPIALIPAFFINWMVYAADGPSSPYYAGLNLILLAISVVVHWSLLESLIATLGMFVMYLAACMLHVKQISGGNIPQIFYSNLIFLFETGVIVVVGNYFFTQLRLSEFALRYELDKNKQVLEKQKNDLEAAMTQLKEAEAELVQNEKLASIGRLGAGIMHEINNPLNYAQTGLYTLKKKARYLPLDQQPSYNETLADVEEGVKRVSAIVSDLRSFAHNDNESLNEVPASEIVLAALRFMSHEWSEFPVKIEQDIPAEQKLRVNKNKLIQVCVNLLQNSLDSLKAKSAGNGQPAEPVISIKGSMENGLSVLAFRDNGMGIKPEHVGKIFDPFFTTKDVGEGMGMGLSICHRIVNEYQGRIRVGTEPGKYCEFTLEFPLNQ